MAAWSNPLLTGYEPKTCTDVSSEHTPINCPSRRNSFNTDNNDLTTTVTASETPDMREVGQSTSPLFQEREVSSYPFCVSGFQQQAAASGVQQQASSSGIHPWPIADLWGTRKLVRGNESISSVEGTLSTGKRERDLESVQTLSERRNLHAYLAQKAGLAVQHKCAAQKRLCEAEEIGNKEMLILPSTKPIEHSNLKDWSSIRRLNGPIRLKEKRVIYLKNWK